jgi:hypothetical protein
MDGGSVGARLFSHDPIWEARRFARESKSWRGGRLRGLSTLGDE